MNAVLIVDLTIDYTFLTIVYQVILDILPAYTYMFL